jgi:hypothetical protein
LDLLREFCGRDLAESRGMKTDKPLGRLPKPRRRYSPSSAADSWKSYMILMGLPICHNLPAANWLGIEQ